MAQYFEIVKQPWTLLKRIKYVPGGRFVSLFWASTCDTSPWNQLLGAGDQRTNKRKNDERAERRKGRRQTAARGLRRSVGPQRRDQEKERSIVSVSEGKRERRKERKREREKERKREREKERKKQTESRRATRFVSGSTKGPNQLKTLPNRSIVTISSCLSFASPFRVSAFPRDEFSFVGTTF